MHSDANRYHVLAKFYSQVLRKSIILKQEYLVLILGGDLPIIPVHRNSGGSMSNLNAFFATTYNAVRGIASQLKTEENPELVQFWNNLKDSLPEDKLTEDIFNYVDNLWMKLAKSNGLPFVTLTLDDYSRWVEEVSVYIPGIENTVLYNLAHTNSEQIYTTALDNYFKVLPLKEEDRDEIEGLLESFQVSELLAINPFVGLFTLSSIFYAYTVVNKFEFAQKDSWQSQVANKIFFATSLVGLPTFYYMTVATCAVKLVRDKVTGETSSEVESYEWNLSKGAA